MLDDFWFSDPSTHIFHAVRRIKRHAENLKLLGVYSQRIDAANVKIRFAAFALDRLGQLLRELERGEFIYFDDASRLTASFLLESYLLFLRASLDTSASAYSAYFSGNTNLDSVNDLLKKLPAWIPTGTRSRWMKIKATYDSVEYEWIHMIVGRDKGQSLRDMAVHRASLQFDTIIDSNNKGQFILVAGRDAIFDPLSRLSGAFDNVHGIIRSIVSDIQMNEAGLP